MSMNIYEAWSYYVTSSVDYFFGKGVLQVTDGVNVISRDCDIPSKRFRTGAINDPSSTDQQVTSIWCAVDTH